MSFAPGGMAVVSTNSNVFRKTTTNRSSASTETFNWLVGPLHAAIEINLLQKEQDHLHQDNGNAHVERLVIEFVAKKGWELLPHPPYSTMEAPTDYHDNLPLKNWQAN
ncbi:hypothetical protein ANCDUO_06032 [Ancylostoma duodenale]|uniref:Tc1-like transposase DDE domain-containing protein n=1 Tax=Ancylostoma duodenale TaxID=51022 RepID=A0A0C2GX65_9BILA|nr:hypothetical protein ANCDUO_06032 [Ancylostoma duodenale]